MGAVQKFYELISTTTPRQSLEFISQGRNLGGSGESIASSQGGGGSQANWRSTTNQNVTVDWGDGTSDVFALSAGVFFQVTGENSGRKVYSSSFGFGVTKQIKVTFSNPQAIDQFALTNWWLRGNLSTAIDILASVVSLGISNNFLDFLPANIANLPNLQQLGLSSSASVNGVIPPYIFGISTMTTFFFERNSIGSKTYEEANYTRLQELPNLTRLDIGSNGFTELPSCLFDIPSINYITFNEQRPSPNELTPDIPSNAALATNWKQYWARGCYRAVSTVDTFINNFYALVVANASMTGSASLPFRGMAPRLDASSAIPTGVYRQPAGFILGSNNGTPLSPQEKIWVLTTQYLALVTMLSYNVSAISVGSTTQLTLNFIAPGNTIGTHLQIGSVVHFKNISGTVGAALNGLDHTITNIAGNVITISTDTTGLAYTSGGNLYRVTL